MLPLQLCMLSVVNRVKFSVAVLLLSINIGVVGFIGV